MSCSIQHQKGPSMRGLFLSGSGARFALFRQHGEASRWYNQDRQIEAAAYLGSGVASTKTGR